MYLFVAGLVIALFAGQPAQASNVAVTVYYESLCPDSIRFYTKQLYPTLANSNLSTYVDLDLIPYGKANHTKQPDGSWKFVCQHGDEECYGNKVQACALAKLTSKNERLSYLNCLLKSMLPDRTIPYPTEKCAKQVQLPSKESEDIMLCANSTAGSDLLVKNGELTEKLQPKLTSVPTVVFNNAFNMNDFNQAQTDFQGVLCKYIPSPKPAECTSGSTAISASLAVIMATLFLLFSNF